MFNRESIRDHYPCTDFPDGVCPNRHPGCQDKCLAMLAAKLVADERKHVEHANRAKQHDASGCAVESRKRRGKKLRQV